MNRHSLAQLATIGLILWRRGKLLYEKWKKSEAMVVRNKFTQSDMTLFDSIDPVANEAGTFYTVIEFKTDKGETITKQLDIGTNPPRQLGQRMLVIYNPNNPLEFVTYPRTMFEIIPGLLIALGLIGLLISIVDILGLISIFPD